MTRHWAKWMPLPSPSGEWMVAVFSADKPSGITPVIFKLDDGAEVPSRVDASRPQRVKNGVWACLTDEHMTTKTVPPCGRCGQPSRMPVSAGGLRHNCVVASSGKPKSPSATQGEDTLF